MSYDLAVFDSRAAPHPKDDFLAWFDRQSEWGEHHSYDDPKVSTPELRAWFLEMIETYPAMNGPYSRDDLPRDEASVTDYSVGQSIVYAGFAWSKADDAHRHVFMLAEKHGLGFFNVSSATGDVWIPGADGKLTRAHPD